MANKLTDTINSFLRKRFGIQITKVKRKPTKVQQPQFRSKYLHDPVYSYMVSPKYKEMLIEELAEIADHFFTSGIISLDSNLPFKTLIEDFFEVYTNRKKIDNTHGSGFHNAFWIYLFARALNPELIVESGVWKGHTSWLLEQACPSASIFGFDRNLSFLEYKNLRATLIEKDWGTFQFPEFNPEKAFVFFDCHVNNAQRILEAKSKGFEHIIIDDNPPAHKIYRYVPGIPTAAMLYYEQGLEKSEISWVWNNVKKMKPIDINEAIRAKELIKIHQVFPDVGGPTGYGGFDYLTYVQI